MKVKGDLATLKNGRYLKHCWICCMQLQAHDYKLHKHFNAHHKGEAAGFLKYDQEPSECIYENFKKYLRDPRVELRMTTEAIKRLKGRPVKPQVQEQ